MARVNVYLPDDLAAAAKAAGLNVSGLTQDALRKALAANEVDSWLDEVDALDQATVPHEAVLEAVAAAKDEFEG